ncbi:MAG: DUF1566 domain-containing protein [Bacteroidales bacterium]|nr:DUF1566 domain-containing protein [Bacteroidales bacterium]
MKRVFLCIVCLLAMMAAGMELKAQEITITLFPNWTWISYPKSEVMDIATALGDFVPMEGDVIKSQFGFSVYENGQWSGNMQQFTPGLGYMYYSNRSEAVSFVFGGSTFQSQVFVTTTANPTEGGTVTGGGTYQEGEFCMVTAMANEGYTFTSWTEDGVVVSTDATYSFIVETDRNLVANFAGSGLPYYQDFASSFGTYTTYDVAGSQSWEIDYSTAKMSGYAYSTNYANEDWLISSPVAITGVSDAKMTMVYIGRYFNNINDELTIWASTDYTWGSNPVETTWTQVSANLTEGSNWYNFLTVEIALTQFVGQTVTFAVKYTSSNSNAGTVEIQSITIEECGGDGPNPPTPDDGDHAYVDLGLPSGLLWATCNVGAETPEEYGDYFAWGETVPKDYYDWSTYQYCNGDYYTLTKYCNDSYYGNNGFTDNLATLLPEDDAATANWGNGWRMPTEEDWQELLDNTTNTCTTQNGVSGILFTASNGNSLFLPAAGYRYYSDLYNAGSSGDYWSSSLSTDYPSDAWDFEFDSGGYVVLYYYNRYFGFTVRPVRSASQN